MLACLHVGIAGFFVFVFFFHLLLYLLYYPASDMGTDSSPHIPNADGFLTPFESALRKALGRAGSDEKEKKILFAEGSQLEAVCACTGALQATRSRADALCSYCWLPEVIN